LGHREANYTNNLDRANKEIKFLKNNVENLTSEVESLRGQLTNKSSEQTHSKKYES
jgi:archaellum component FlaC